MSSAKGFTIELLVVIAIIAVLGLLLPARTKSNRYWLFKQLKAPDWPLCSLNSTYGYFPRYIFDFPATLPIIRKPEERQ